MAQAPEREVQSAPQRAVGPVPRIGADDDHADNQDLGIRELPRDGVQPRR